MRRWEEGGSEGGGRLLLSFYCREEEGDLLPAMVEGEALSLGDRKTEGRREGRKYLLYPINICLYALYILHSYTSAICLFCILCTHWGSSELTACSQLTTACDSDLLWCMPALYYFPHLGLHYACHTFSCLLRSVTNQMLNLPACLPYGKRGGGGRSPVPEEKK